VAHGVVVFLVPVGEGERVIVYFLPGRGIFGGIKVGYQFVESLNDLGFQAVIASPGGLAEQWFTSRAVVVDADEILSHWDATDIAVFSHPADFSRVAGLCRKRVFHCQGTDPRIDVILADLDTRVFTCWQQAAESVSRTRSDSFSVGISVSDRFFYAGERKDPLAVAYMPRRGEDFIEEVLEGFDQLTPLPIDQANEEDVASRMLSSSIFLASSKDEWFGLPSLEAMAAGCLVLSPPVLGGMEYLRHGQNAIVGEVAVLRKALEGYLWEDPVSQSLRSHAIATSHRYRRGKATAMLSEAVNRGALEW